MPKHHDYDLVMRFSKRLFTAGLWAGLVDWRWGHYQIVRVDFHTRSVYWKKCNTLQVNKAGKWLRSEDDNGELPIYF